MTSPPGWLQARLDEIAEVRLGRQRSPDKAYGDNLVPYLRAANVRWGGLDLTDVKCMQFSPEEVETFRLRRDDILVVEASGSRNEVGKSALWREEFPLVCLQNTLIRVRSRGVDPEFLRWHLHLDASTGDLGGASKGIGIHHIGAARLASWTINVPPLKQQRRIVAKLDVIFEGTRAAKARLERLPSLLDTLKRSILASALRGDLTADWRAAHPDVERGSALLERIRTERRASWETARRVKGKGLASTNYISPESVEGAELPELPASWAWTRAEEVCGFITKGTTPAATRMKSEGGTKDVPFIKVYNLTFDGRLDFTIEPTFVDAATHQGELARSRVLPGDVLMNIVGPPLGKVSLVPATFPEWNINQAIAVFRPLRGLSRDYLRFALMFLGTEHRTIARAKATSGQLNLTLEICRGLAIPLPPEEEQEEIVRRLDVALDTLLALQVRGRSILSRTEALERAALAKAFRGELVEQDPDDEPVATLLDRMRAEAANVDGTAVTGRKRQAPRTSRRARVTAAANEAER